jgi:hypothetical protein
MLNIKIIYYRNIVRYIESSNENKMARRTVAQMITHLEVEKYDRIYRKYVNMPSYEPTEQLMVKAFGPKANYDYLIDVTDRQKSAENLAKQKQILAELEAQLDVILKKNRIGYFRGAGMWLEELDQLEMIYLEGVSTNWRFGEEGDYEYD